MRLIRDKPAEPILDGRVGCLKKERISWGRLKYTIDGLERWIDSSTISGTLLFHLFFNGIQA
jgi:hypothetical protein